MNQPQTLRVPAFAIAENLYYVGNHQFSSHLLVGTRETVLIDTGYPTHVKLLEESIRSVGIDPSKITLILHTHAHYDHYGATYRMKKLSGARTAIGRHEIRGPLTKPYVLEPGVLKYCQRRGWPYEPFEIDMLLEDGQTIDIGGTVIHCHHTPGHTRGTMSYTFEVHIDGKTYTAGLFGGPGLHVLKDRGMSYPGNRDDFARTFRYLRTLHVDVPLGAHPFLNDTLGKCNRLKKGEKPNPFIDPGGWTGMVDKLEAEFNKIVASEPRPSH